ncbi:Uu.00g091750.m01.CDS01 [Anthostomella pinea]|uniref:Uu.00g091750.m01.CDS01 n=1 Tax=Anthostomella pinea TaxID=933095 RepID=A0AAI8VN41_9PEZI|nr:Uu.00g091750.m01.CDS01 [Anthostomella pinea]
MSLPQKRGPWSQHEDEVLMHLVHQQGPLNWVRISQQLNSRTPKQCRERYHQNLKPSLNHEPITPEEGLQIEFFVHQLGKRWAEIARKLNNRSDNAVKNWWNGSMNRRKRMMHRRGPGAGARASYEDPETSHRYARSPAPPRLATLPPYSTYPSYRQPSPSAPRLNWNPHSGLPSPSITSPGADSLDGAPSLLSDTGSPYNATSPTAGPFNEAPIELPPLRWGDADSPKNLTFGPGPGHGPSPTLPPLSARHDQFRLPPIRDCVDERSSLPTAPNSPVQPASRLPYPHLSGPSRDDERSEQMERMRMSNFVNRVVA